MPLQQLCSLSSPLNMPMLLLLLVHHCTLQCIVAAELVALAGPSGIKCGGAMLRDVGVYCLAIFSVLLAFALGQVSVVLVGNLHVPSR